MALIPGNVGFGSNSEVGTNIIDVRFSTVSRHSRDQIGVLTNEWCKLRRSEVPARPPRRGAAGMLQRAQLGKKGLSVKRGVKRVKFVKVTFSACGYQTGAVGISRPTLLRAKDPFLRKSYNALNACPGIVGEISSTVNPLALTALTALT